VILVTELQLEENREGLETCAARNDVKFFDFQPWITLIERDIRVYLQLPFPRTVVDELRRIITVFVEFIAGDLALAAGAARRPVTVPTKLRQLQETGESILADLGPYTELADHYYNEKVKRERLNRPSNEVSAEIDSITEKAKDLRTRIVQYLKDLSRAIRETSAHDEAPG
jgi:hypothetical protein